MKLCSFFRKKSKEKKELKKYVIKTPLIGKCIDIKDVEDYTFSNNLLGEGVAIIPEKSGYIKSPIDGKITKILDSLNAFIVENDDNISVLVHFGLNSVELEGAGFTKLLSEGDLVKATQNVIKYDLDYILSKGVNVTTPVLILDFDEKEYEISKISINQNINEGDNIIIIEEK